MSLDVALVLLDLEKVYFYAERVGKKNVNEIKWCSAGAMYDVFVFYSDTRVLGNVKV